MKYKRRQTKPQKAGRPKKGFKVAVLLILFPLAAAGFTGYYLFSHTLAAQLGIRANNQLVTENWQSAQLDMATAQPQYTTKVAYYKLLPGQNLDWAAAHFGVSLSKLQQLNPGRVVVGTTIAVPPLEQPFSALPATSSSPRTLVIEKVNGAVNLSNSFKLPKVNTTIPQLYKLLKPYDVIEQLSAKTYIILKPLYIEGNIRLDITNDTVDLLELKSSPDFDIVALTFRSSEVLIKNTKITSVDLNTQKPDTNFEDGRSFVRAYESGRMDIINSTLSYMGMDLTELRDPLVRARAPFISEGGVYGVSWRIPTGALGQDIVTGWVQNSTFEHNHIGSFTFGASGMMWLNNLFTANDIYGLDPHDDSNNATIEYNRFIKNGKHGFIVSKRCDYNIIRNNISIDNKLHGFMLHEDSAYNLIEGNISLGNVDNYVIYQSNFNTVRGNRSYNPRGSHMRINASSLETFVEDNVFYGGNKGVYIYGDSDGVDVKDNTFFGVTNLLTTNGAKRVIFTGNKSEKVGYSLAPGDRVVFGLNTIDRHPYIDSRPLEEAWRHSKDPTKISLDIL